MKFQLKIGRPDKADYILLGFVLLLLIFIVYFYFFSNKREPFDNSRESLNKNIDAVYYINLSHRKDRQNEFLDNFSEKDAKRMKRIQAHYYPENGAVGCLMSHISALNIAWKENLGENILICEDDFYIKDMNYLNKMLDLFFENIHKWDVVMLGQNTSQSKETGIQTESNEKVIKILDSQTASGYVIKRAYIPVLLQIYERDMMEYLRTNEWGNFYTDQSWKVLQRTDNWYSFSPSVGVQRKSYSDIQKGFINIEV
jgi:GR25 family glycosyltransferase involved in LPS biosynthesis